MMTNVQEFVDYVWDFYNPQSDLYPIKGLTKEDIFDAFKVYQSRLLDAYFNKNESYYFNNNGLYTWGEGDSLDRERVRDIILEKYNLSWSS